MKIAIIGSGAAAFGALGYLTDEQCPAASIDIISPLCVSELDNDVLNDGAIRNFYRSCKRTLVPAKINVRAGVSDREEPYQRKDTNLLLWGCSALPYPADDYETLTRFDSSDFASALKKISEMMPISGARDDKLSAFLGADHLNEMPVKSHRKLKGFMPFLNKSETDHKCLAGTPHIALTHNIAASAKPCDCFINNCSQHTLFLMYQFQHVSNAWGKKIRRIDGCVTDIDWERSSIVIEETNTETVQRKTYDMIFVCAGAFGTAELLLESKYADQIVVHDTASYVVPFLSFGAWKVKKEENFFSLTNLVAFIETRKVTKPERSFIQFYPTSRYFLRRWFPLTVWWVADLITNLLSRYLFIAVIYLDDNSCATVTVTKRPHAAGERVSAKTPKRSGAAVCAVVKVLKRMLGYRFFPLALRRANTSHHFGKLEADGKLLADGDDFFSSKNIYFCGSSVFRHLPASSPTLSICAHGYLVAKAAFEGHVSR